jgi:hypothetical protein
VELVNGQVRPTHTTSQKPSYLESPRIPSALHT